MYTWSLKKDADIWDNATSKTIKECIDDAIGSCELKKGATIYIGECRDVAIGGVDFSSLLDAVEQDMYEQVGDVSEGWNISCVKNRQEIYNKYENQLLKFVKKYLKEIGETPGFYNVINVKSVVIK